MHKYARKSELMIYDFREGGVQETEFCCFDCFIEELLNGVRSLRGFESVSLYAKADFITEVVRELLAYGIDDREFTFGSLQFDGEGNDYVDEYVLSVNDNLSIWIEPAWHDKPEGLVLFDTDSVLTFLHADCNFRIQEKLIKDEESTLLFDFMDYE